MSFDPREFNIARYEEAWAALKKALLELEKSSGLSSALRMLHLQQLDQGFIQDDLSSVIRWRIRDPDHPDAAFTVQHNPRRAERGKGSGRSRPPKGTKSVNNGCFLCRDNIRWQQRGIELGYDILVNSTNYIAFMNPFPLMPTHVTIVKENHEPQSWIGPTIDDSRKRIKDILTDFLEITGRLPGFVGFYNGEGAGASIPGHFHLQFFERPEGRGPFPLEQAASHAQGAAPMVIIDRNKYPITTLYFRGDRRSIVEQATGWVAKWTEVYENHVDLSANVIATKDENKEEEFHLFFVPRNRAYSHAPGMVGLIGGLEVLGELVFTTEIEKQSLDTGRFDYQAARQILAAVEAPGVEKFLSRL